MLAAGQMMSVVARHFATSPNSLTTQLAYRGLVSRTVHPDVLSPHERQVWELHQGGMAADDIADKLGMPDAKIATALNRARAKFARRKGG